MQIAGLQKTTLVDYPGKVAATIFTRGCNFRCSYCHNPELVLPHQFALLIGENEIWAFLEQRRGKIEGVCITGGEPTLHPDLEQFIQRIKNLGFLIKLDSNGTNPDRLKRLIEGGNIDYIAMDIKGPPEHYRAITKAKVAGDLHKLIQQSIDYIMNSGIDYEFRTTVAHPLLDLPDFIGVGTMIRGARRYYLQNYVTSKQVDPDAKLTPFTDAELADALALVRRYVREVAVR